jgi:hypothetical protein
MRKRGQRTTYQNMRQAVEEASGRRFLVRRPLEESCGCGVLVLGPRPACPSLNTCGPSHLACILPFRPLSRCPTWPNCGT